MSITRSLSLASVVTLGLIACGRPPSGPTVVELRPVGEFRAVELRGSARLTIQSGTPTNVTLNATRATLDNTTTEVVNGTLIIRNTKSGSAWENDPLSVSINTPTLEAAEVNGAGRISITGLDQSRLKLVMRGAGKMDAQGKATELDATIEGAGSMDLYPLAAETAKVVVDGAGSVDLNVTAALQATVSGVGKIRYRGKPGRVEKSVHGVGSIEPSIAIQ